MSWAALGAGAFAIATSLAAFSGCGESDAPDTPNPAAEPDASTSSSSPPADGGLGDPARDAAIADAAPQSPELLFPRTGIQAAEMGVIVNDSDPLSVAVANYYLSARKIPAANLVHVDIAGITSDSISAADFAPLKTKVDAAFAGSAVQAIVLTWTKPYRVDNMSITSTFSMGHRAIGDTCNDANSHVMNPYATNKDSTRPFADLGFRPAMTIAATTIEEARALIDRGIASDDTWPKGSAYMMITSDGIRSTRCNGAPTSGECQALLNTWDSSASGVAASIVTADSITNKTDVLFYVQGLASVPDIATNTFLPGAVADHLTSYGGQIPTSGQMSAFEFLKGGATGSYGTVVEPCAYVQKFPDPSVLVPRYFGGNTLIEAYWKSVAWPAEGIFIGEPLARPYGTGFRSRFENGTLAIDTTSMQPGKQYVVEAADSSAGPFSVVLDNLSVTKYRISTLTVPNASRRTYRFRAK